MSEEIKVPETLEEAQALLKAEQEKAKTMEERAIGAEKLIEKHKKKPDPVKPANPETQTAEERNAEMNKVLDERDFYAKNPDLMEYKDKLSELTVGGQFSLDEAKGILEKRDPTILNRKNAKKIDFTTGTPGVAQKTMTQEELSKLSPEEFTRAIQMRDKGEVKII